MKPIRTAADKPKTIEFSSLGRRVVQGSFDAGSMTGDAGVLLLAETDRRLGLTQAAAKCIADPRNPVLITHSVQTMLRQRVYGLALGWEDLTDHDSLRSCIAMRGTSFAAPVRILNSPSFAPPAIRNCISTRSQS